MSPEIRMARSVISQALEDALGISMGASPRDIAEAIAFLTSRLPAQVASRREWCEIAGLDPNQLRERVLARLTIIEKTAA